MPRSVLSSPAPVVAGNLYHMVVENTHADPNNNFVSIDLLSNPSITGTVLTRFMPDEDLRCLRKSSGSTWKLNTVTPPDPNAHAETPVIDVEYSDGTHQGWPYMEVWVGSISGVSDITGTQWLRQRFTPPSNLTFTHLGIAAKQKSGSAPLVLEVHRPYGTILRTVSVPFAALPTKQDWVDPIALSSPLAVTGGLEYFLVFKTSSGTVHNAYPIRDGSKSFGYHTSIGFPNGYCQTSINSGSSWQDWVAFGNSTKQGILCFCFKTA
jgi:hypothetical protein